MTTTIPWYRGESYQVWMVFHDHLGGVISDAFDSAEISFRVDDAAITIPGRPGTASWQDADVQGWAFQLDATTLGSVPTGVHYAQLWGRSGQAAKMISAEIAFQIREGRA